MDKCFHPAGLLFLPLLGGVQVLSVNPGNSNPACIVCFQRTLIVLFIVFSQVITVQSMLSPFYLFQHMKRCRKRKRGESTIGLDRVLSPAKTRKEESSTSTSPSTLTLRTCSETLISTAKTGMNASNGTSRSVYGLTRGTSRELLDPGSSRISLMTWRGCLHLTDMPSGLGAGFTAWQSSTAGL